jgi:hypothetical protein
VLRREFSQKFAYFQYLAGVEHPLKGLVSRKFPVFSLLNREFNRRRVRARLRPPPLFFAFPASKPRTLQIAGVSSAFWRLVRFALKLPDNRANVAK